MVHVILIIIYIAFISLGLPDGLLGAAWPAIQSQFQVPVSWMGPVFLIISAGTVVSSLLSDFMIRKFGTGRVTAYSVAMTAVALLGFAFSNSYWLLCFWAIPYGFGAGSVDSCLNNYVAVHYSGKHMSWLHCMWGVGASVGPYIMSTVLTAGQQWGSGYLCVGIFQLVLTAFLLFSLPLWKITQEQSQNEQPPEPVTLKQAFSLRGAKPLFLAFFCYCALEQTLGQWAASYFYGYLNLSEEISAGLAALYFLGLTAGRAINGFLTTWFSDRQLVRAGIAGIAMGIIVMLIPLGFYGAVVGVLLIGFGSAPIYPCIIHATPMLFGKEVSQAMIGIEMASAYIGICIMPPVFGYIAELTGIWILPIVLLMLMIIMHLSHERLYIRTENP